MQLRGSFITPPHLCKLCVAPLRALTQPVARHWRPLAEEMATDTLRTVFSRLAQVKGYIRCKSKAMKALVGRMMKVRCAHCACCACSGFCAFWRSGSAPTLAPYAGLARLLLQQKDGDGKPFSHACKV